MYEYTVLIRFFVVTDGWYIEMFVGSVYVRKMVWCCGGYGGVEFRGLRNWFLLIIIYIGVISLLGLLL